MSPLNDYVEKCSFKLEGWEEMLDYAKEASFGIKFDLKKFYHEIDISPQFQTYFGFTYVMEDGKAPEYFVWQTLPYGYTRAPYIARHLMKPLIGKWRKLGVMVIVFYDDGMAVANCPKFLEKVAVQMQVDLLMAGLVPGVDKCVWEPTPVVSWNGLVFDMAKKELHIMVPRLERCVDNISELLFKWPNVTFREVSRCLGRILSLHPVFGGSAQLRSRMLQTIVNIRHYKNLGWDTRIVVDYAPLLVMAQDELKFWAEFAVSGNSKSFFPHPHDWVIWSDASDRGIGALVVQLTDQGLGSFLLTADNLLLTMGGTIPPIKKCVSLQADALPWAGLQQVLIRDKRDLNPANCASLDVCFRNLDFDEQSKDSNERELIAAHYCLLITIHRIKGSTVTLYLDSQNAVIVLTKGSSKPRLQFYAVAVADLCLKFAVTLRPIWIPRDLNNVADWLSNRVQWDDFSVTV